MGRIFRRYLEGPKIYCCSTCGTHLSTNDQIISRRFRGRGGQAYLFNRAVNVMTGPSERRVLITGLHVVADIYCIQCESLIGWTYEEAFDRSQKYKEGKFILEKTKITKSEWSEDVQRF
uniref:Protein yippee-like n=1 Tax=Pinguiococcus pyrenoidosus TaxID=172671 RepID=A0A7R9U7K2_9STRA|mmetsp:Transcript_16983/g.64693  ORF Transcript_16983/g.64693 Transcript_16983/m.64693 type:complete len:119 (+) Transcript_16983:145-501(+)